MSIKQQWLDAGLATLVDHGAPAVTIDRLCGLLGLSKGSFYHHFGGLPGYRTALLEHFEARYTTRFIEAVEERPERGPRERLAMLMDLVLDGDGREAGLEVAMRSWALQEPEVRAVQERVDRRRTEYLRELWREISGDEREARHVAQMLYAILIGAGHTIPQVEPADLRAIFQLALRGLDA